MPQDARDLKGKTGIRRLINATRYSRDGFLKAFQTEEAFRQESILSVIGLVALFFIQALCGFRPRVSAGDRALEFRRRGCN